MKKDKNKGVETIVLNNDSAERLIKTLENPPEPTKELKELMNGSIASE